MTVSDCLADFTNKLNSSGINTAHLDSIILLEHVLDRSREWLISHGDYSIPSSKVDILYTNLKRRINYDPVAYIVGSKEFYGRKFIVNPNVLIPRPESEDIINLLLDSNGKWSGTVIDIGTGSGCLAITTKLEIPDCSVLAIDISDKALAVAKQNAALHNAEVTFIRADLLKNLNVTDNTVILANLPYVPNKTVTSKEVLKEPKNAIFSGQDGLTHYKKFFKQLGILNKKPLLIITESLKSQHKHMIKIAKTHRYKISQSRGLIQLFQLDQ